MRLSNLAMSVALLLGTVSLTNAGCKGKPKAAEVKDVVQVTIDEDGFKPDKIAAKRGRALTLVFNRTTDKTCATEVVIASENIRKPIPMNAATPITFIPEKAGEVPFACPMNMIKGTITVLP